MVKGLPRYKMTKDFLDPSEFKFLAELMTKIDLYLDNKESELTRDDLQTPKEIYEHLNEYVVGHETAKKILSVAAHNHLKRALIYVDSNYETKIDKSNVLIIGPTGCGKTHLVKTLASYLKVPYYIADANSLTASGYVGKDVESIIDGLIDNAGGHVSAAQTGIIFIDEFDKIKKTTSSSGKSDRDISGESVQQALLKIIEGTTVDVERNDGMMKTKYQFDTSFLMVVLGGSFAGLETVIEQRLSKDVSIGFGKTVNKTEIYNFDEVTQEDLEKFGFIPEILGRISNIAVMKALTTDELLEILSGIKNNQIDQYKEMFKFSGNDLSIDENTMKAIAELAQQSNRGARSIKYILEKLLLDLMFENTSGKLTFEDVKKISAISL